MIYGTVIWKNCHRQCFMESTQSSPHPKSRAIMGFTWSQRKKWVALTASGTSIRRSWAGTWTAYKYTIQFPPKKCKDICTLMRKIFKNLRVALNQFQKLAGKLQYVSLGIPIGRSLFTPLDMAMRGDPDFITITPIVRQCLEDWRCLIQCMAKEPTSVMQLIMCPPS